MNKAQEIKDVLLASTLVLKRNFYINEVHEIENYLVLKKTNNIIVFYKTHEDMINDIYIYIMHQNMQQYKHLNLMIMYELDSIVYQLFFDNRVFDFCENKRIHIPENKDEYFNFSLANNIIFSYNEIMEIKEIYNSLSYNGIGNLYLN